MVAKIILAALFQFSSVTQSCLTLCYPMDCSMPGLPVHHQFWALLKLMSIELLMPSNHPILCHPLLLLPSIFPSIRVFSNELALHIRWPNIGASASASVLPKNFIQGWFPVGLTSFISLLSKGLLRVFSSTTIKSISALALSLLYDPTLIFKHDYWKNHSLDYIDLCWQSNVSAF